MREETSNVGMETWGKGHANGPLLMKAYVSRLSK